MHYKNIIKIINPAYLLAFFIIGCGSESAATLAADVDNGYEIGESEVGGGETGGGETDGGETDGGEAGSGENGAGDTDHAVGDVSDVNNTANRVAEDAVIGSEVGITANAVDADSDAAGAVSYTLSDNAGGLFAIHAATGVVTVAGNLDFETAQSHTIKVKATSTDNTVSEESFTINVDNVGGGSENGAGDTDHAVGDVSDVNDTVNRVAEDAGYRREVGITANAVDADSDAAGAVSYTLSDNAGGLFAIHAATGVVTVAGRLDFETARSHTIKVKATSTDGSVSEESFTINVDNVGGGSENGAGDTDHAVGDVSDVNDTANHVAEDAAIGSEVGVTANAVDADSDAAGAVSYTLSDNAGGLFAIHAPTGVVTVSGNLDFETAGSHTIKVKATSADGSVSEESFTINVDKVGGADIAIIPPFTTTLYIDATLAHSCSDYNLSSRTCGSGSERAFNSLAASAVAAAPGVNFQIRGGDYNEMLHVNTSGTPDAYLGYTAYEGEVVTLLDVDAWVDNEDYGAIWLDHVSYVWLNEIDVRGSVGFGRLLDSHHNIISNSDFSESRLWGGSTGASKRGGLYVAFSHYNRLLNNRFYKGTDSLAMIHSDHNLVEGNTMDRAGHDIWNIKCGSFNVIRNNEFSNEDQKLGSVFDCESATMAWYGNAEFKQDTAVVDRSQHNLIEDNVFRDTVKEDATGDGNGIQYAGQNGIIRRNLFYRVNVGVGMATYSGEATYNYGNRIYNNVFHDNGCAAIVTGKPSLTEKMTDNAYLNNIIWDNQGAGATNCTDKNAKQILWRAREDGGDRFVNNDIASRLGEEVLGGWGTERGFTVAGYEASIDAMKFMDNLAVDPRFVSELANDYRLQATSPMIDTAALLTTVRSASGSGTTLQLADVNYFYDGFGILGEVGDRVQVGGRAETAIITNINYENKTITLDRPLTWQQDDGIGLSYNGEGPDLGAFEH